MTSNTTNVTSADFNAPLVAGEVLTRLRVLGVPVTADAKFGSTVDAMGVVAVHLSIEGISPVCVVMDRYSASAVDAYHHLAERLAEETYRQYKLAQAPDPVEDFS